MDALFVTPNSSEKAYQDLAKVYSAIEPPTWSLLLSESCRSKSYSVEILDTDAERLTLEESANRIIDSKTRLVIFVLYGQNPNSGTTSMIGAIELASMVKELNGKENICFVGSHVSALPKEVLALDCVDIVLLNEGVYALHDLLASNLSSDLSSIKGIGYTENDGFKQIPKLNQPQKVVPQDRMDVDLPGYAWDLLPYKDKPLDLYRAHFWHANFNHKQRTPFAAIYTSLGCQFSCSFCMINIINRVDNLDGVSASDFKGMRFWSPQWVARELEKLAKLGVKTLRISDEMFFLNKKYYTPILENLINTDYRFNMWTYSRIDTVRKDALEIFKKAGVNWLALGIEAGNQTVRQKVSKGTFKEVNIREVCQNISQADIKIISNYIFGFPEDTLQTMQDTLELALELNTEMANMYPCQALPGSPLYMQALQNDWELPKSYEEFAFLSYESRPLPTKTLASNEVLEFRDNAWQTYFSNPDYLNLVERKFGHIERKNIEDMSKIRLRRALLGD